MQAMSLNFALAQKKTQALQLIKIKQKAIDMRVIFDINDTLNDSLQKLLMQVYENLTTCVPNSTIYNCQFTI